MADEKNVVNDAAEAATDNLKKTPEYSDAVKAGMQNAANIQNAAGSTYNGITGSPEQGARMNPFDNMQTQNPYTQGNPYDNMQNMAAQGTPVNPYDNMQANAGENPYYQGTPETPEGGKPAKKKMSKGKKIGIISGIVAFVAILTVCGFIFIPKLFKPKKETIVKAVKASGTSIIEGNTIVRDFGLVEMGESIKNNGGKVVVKARNPKNVDDKIDVELDFDTVKQEASVLFDIADNNEKASGKAYANREKAYFTADDLMTGYYYIDLATAASDYINSYFAEEYGSSYNGWNGGFLDSFVDLDEAGAISKEQLAQLKEIFTRLKDSIDYSKDGSKKLSLGGNSYDATKYVLTIPKKELQNAISDGFDVIMNSAVAGSSNGEYYAAMISSYISTIVSKDVKINLYVYDDKVIAMETGYEIDVIGNKASIDVKAQFEGKDNLFSAFDGSVKITVDNRTMEYVIKYDSYDTATGSEMVAEFMQIVEGDVNQQIECIINYNKETSDIVVTTKYPLSGDYFNSFSGKVLSLEKGKKLEIQFDTLTDNSPYNYYGATTQKDGVNYTDIDVFIGLYSDYTIEKVPSDAKLVNFFTDSESEFKSIMTQEMQNKFDEWLNPVVYEWEEGWDYGSEPENERDEETQETDTTEAGTTESTTAAPTTEK